MASKRNQPKVADAIRRAMVSSGKSRYWIARGQTGPREPVSLQ